MFDFSKAKMRVDRNAKRVAVEEFDKMLKDMMDTGEVDADVFRKWFVEKIDFLYTDLDKRIHGQRVTKVEADDPKFAEAITENWNGCIERIRAVVASVNIKL